VFAFLISVAGWWLAWIAGLLATIILLLACCIDMPRGMFMAAAICGFIAAIGEFLVAAGVVDYTILQNDSLNIDIGNSSLMIMAIIAGVLWVVAAGVAYDYGR